MKYDCFEEFMVSNRELLHSDELRPAKSITRNIITAVKPFVDYYKETKQINLDSKEISRNILKLDTDMSSTTRDNIRNLEELQFLAKSNATHQYRFTRNFVDFVNSGLEVREYILIQLNSIKQIEDVTMFYNCILSLLFEAIKCGFIVQYPDSFKKFINKVSDYEKRKELCEKVYEIYGFSSRNTSMGDYTPNANYRFLSTCVSLGLIKRIGVDEYGFGKYVLSNHGENVLNKINSNMSWIKNNMVQEEVVEYKIDKVEVKLYDDLSDKDYNDATESIDSEMLEDIVDLPVPLANTFGNPINKRDAKKGANAKKRANYLCEYNKNHKSFETFNFSNYVEAHHLIPLSIQKKFMLSLDVEANIVALCSNCHNLLHYGTYNDKEPIIKKLYQERISRLKNCGIFISEEDLLNVYR